MWVQYLTFVSWYLTIDTCNWFISLSHNWDFYLAIWIYFILKCISQSHSNSKMEMLRYRVRPFRIMKTSVHICTHYSNENCMLKSHRNYAKIIWPAHVFVRFNHACLLRTGRIFTFWQNVWAWDKKFVLHRWKSVSSTIPCVKCSLSMIYEE